MDYLTKTLDSLAKELPGTPSDPFSGQVEVHIMKNKGIQKRPHEVFDRLQARFQSHPKSSYFNFVENSGTLQDPNPNLPDPDDNNNPTNTPGRFVRQQTCDVVSLIRTVAPRAKHFMFMEDDFETCQNALRAIQYAMEKVYQYQGDNWIALRVSYGMNGIIMKSETALEFADYLWKHSARLPPDLLYGEYREQHSNRPLMAYRFNLFNHIGQVSSLPRPGRPAFPVCFDGLDNVWSLSAEESFNMQMCSVDDISPCRPGQGVPQLVDWRSSCYVTRTRGDELALYQ